MRADVKRAGESIDRALDEAAHVSEYIDRDLLNRDIATAYRDELMRFVLSQARRRFELKRRLSNARRTQRRFAKYRAENVTPLERRGHSWVALFKLLHPGG